MEYQAKKLGGFINASPFAIFEKTTRSRPDSIGHPTSARTRWLTIGMQHLAQFFAPVKNTALHRWNRDPQDSRSLLHG
jgi:hypothetical protein